jgi:hypothetical protein
MTLLTAPFANSGKSTAQRRMADLLHDTVSSQKLKNTNSRYSKDIIAYFEYIFPLLKGSEICHKATFLSLPLIIEGGLP